MIDQGQPTIKPAMSKPMKKGSSFLNVEKKDQAKVVLLVTLLITLVVVYFFTLPSKANYRDNLINFENRTNEKESLLQKQDTLRKLVSDKEARAGFLSLVEDSLPQKSDVPELIVTLEKIAENNLLVLNSITPREDFNNVPEGEVVKYRSIRVEFTITGSYNNMKEFLKDLEDNIRPVSISSVSVVSDFNPVIGGEETLRFNITANIYYESTT